MLGQEELRAHVMPMKGNLEKWYFENRNFWLDLKIIFLTAWVILFPGSDLHFKVLKGLPPMPEFMLNLG
ncbi:MAG: sugar transferase [Desulfobacterota bacterium]|nr:sugar transferase [Thermodesulfobacteriota bacterium]